MQIYKCFDCSNSFTEADKAWDIAIDTGRCPKCLEALRNFPIPLRKQNEATGKILNLKNSDEVQLTNSESSTQASNFCTNCGTKTLPMAKYCFKCGSAVNDEILKIATELNESNLLNNISGKTSMPKSHPDTSDDMHSLYRAVIGENNYIYYIKKFEEFDRQSSGIKASWNWSAFFCNGVWALYRKMYGWFFAYLGVNAISSFLYMAGLLKTSIFIQLLATITFAIYANYLYHNSTKGKITLARLTVKNEAKLFEYLRFKGGVHRWVWFVWLIPAIFGVLAAIIIPILVRH